MSLSFQSYKSKGLLQGDITIWVALIALCLISVIEVYSASSGISYKTGKYWLPMAEHGLFVCFGFFMAWLAHLVPCKLYKLLSLFLIVVSFFMLVWALSVEEKTNDAGRWVTVMGKTFQPSEFAKLAIIGFVAYIMAICRDKNNNISSVGLKIICVVVAVFAILIGMENFSTACLLTLVVFVMLILGDAPRRFTLPLFLLGSAAVVLVGLTLYFMPMQTAKELGEKYKPLHRLPTWVHRIQDGNTLPEDPNDYNVIDNQQVAHAKIAVATCNYVGKGPGKSVERDYLPQAFSDFIYAIIIEEGGLEAAILVMLCYLLVIYRSWKISTRCAKLFPTYLVMGLAFMLVLQAFINMGVAVGILPVTGQPLPLISKGGTSYIITCIYIGMILSVSRSAKKIDEPALATAGSSEANYPEIEE